MLKIHILHFFGHVTGLDVRAGLQLEDLAFEKEECYGLTSACSINSEGAPTSRNFTTQ